jgi:hypothetical protein
MYNELIMRKLFLTSAFFVMIPFIFLFSLILSLVLYRNSSPQVLGTRSVAYAAVPTYQNIFHGSAVVDDGRIERVRQFFKRYNSPLEPYAADIVNAADEYGLDFRLLPAIAMQESGLCKTIPDDSHNCWGFGIYGSKVTRFSDYPEAIDTVTRTLATKYKSKGLVTPEEIMTMYTPSSNGSWAFSVNYFMNQLQ